MTRFAIRSADRDDAPELAELLAVAFAGSNACYPEPEPPSEADLAVRMQTGEAFLLAECEGRVVGAVRRSEAEGIAGFDLLASREAGAGRALIRAIEGRAQDGGLRLVRARLPDERGWPTTSRRSATCPSAAPTRSFGASNWPSSRSSGGCRC